MDMLVRTASNEAHGSEHCLLLCITRTVSLAVHCWGEYTLRRRVAEASIARAVHGSSPCRARVVPPPCRARVVANATRAEIATQLI